MKVAGSGDGAALQQVACNQRNADQNFTLLQNEDGSFKIMSELSRRLLRLQNGVASQTSPAGNSFQSWLIEAP